MTDPVGTWDWNALVASLPVADQAVMSEAVGVVHGLVTDLLDGRDPRAGFDALSETLQAMSRPASEAFFAWWRWQTREETA